MKNDELDTIIALKLELEFPSPRIVTTYRTLEKAYKLLRSKGRTDDEINSFVSELRWHIRQYRDHETSLYNLIDSILETK